ncbi:MAG: amino acid ABC transporter permease, partial [Planctomycetales bacterium]|nr:amino acid ABC transporter permease [Planctomycetales bacterium]
MKRPWCCVLVLLLVALVGCGREARIASKSFTESVVLCEIAREAGSTDDAPVEHLWEVGGTQVLWQGLLRGDLDAYPDYTGTIAEDIFPQTKFPTQEAQRYELLKEKLAEKGVLMTAPLGFNNTYAIGMTKQRAAELGVKSLSDLAGHPDLKFGFSPEFMNRSDGWPGLKAAYAWPYTDASARGIQHSLAYKALAEGEIDAMDLYATDPKIKQLDLVALVDDREFFPQYNAVFLYRDDLPARAPLLVAAMNDLAGRLDDETMMGLNEQVELHKRRESAVAAEFVGAAQATSPRRSAMRRIARATAAHLYLVL